MNRRLGTVHPFTLSASSQSTAAFGSQTYKVRVATNSQAAYILIGNGVLTASSTNGSLIPPGWAEDFDVTPGQVLATIESSTLHGALSVTELA